MKNDNWSDIGITGESHFLNLLFEPISESLVAHFRRALENGYPIKSLYARRIGDKKYRRLTKKSDILTYEDVVLSPTGPSIFVNIWELDSECGGLDWHSLQAIEVPSGKITDEIRDGELHVATSNNRAWISKLHGVSSAGDVVFASVGLKEPTGPDTSKVYYHLARIHLGGKHCELITALGRTFL